jgi:hypothetical protein
VARIGCLCFAGISLFIGSSVASANIFNFNGTFTRDDDQASFLMVLNAPQNVTIETTQYANGGFAPVLSIFGAPLFAPGDPSLLGTNSGGFPCSVWPKINPATGLCLDALLGYDPVLGTNQLGTLSAGTYLVILTEQANTPSGPDLDSGFAFEGQGNFTAIPGVNNGPFVDPGNPNSNDTGSYAVGFQNASFVAPTPEPSAWLPLLAGIGALVAVRRR